MLITTFFKINWFYAIEIKMHTVRSTAVRRFYVRIIRRWDDFKNEEKGSKKI